MDAYQPLGTVVVGGLIAGTLLSLVVVPVFYAGLDDAGSWLRRRFFPKPANGATRIEAKDGPPPERELQDAKR